MTFTLLGTGTSQGIPVIGCTCETCISTDPRDDRLRCSAWIKTEHTNIIIDVGPDFRTQCLKYGVKDLDAVFLTHEHNDHMIGLDDARPFMFKARKALPVYAEQRVLEDVTARFAYAFEEQIYPGAPRFEMKPISSYVTTEIGDVKIQALRTMHGPLPILGYLINDKVAYLTDSNAYPDETMNILKGVDVLIIDMLREQEHHSHNNFAKAMDYARLIGAKKTYLIHMSHLMGPVKKWEERLPEGVYAGYDGLALDLQS